MSLNTKIGFIKYKTNISYSKYLKKIKNYQKHFKKLKILYQVPLYVTVIQVFILTHKKIVHFHL